MVIADDTFQVKGMTAKETPFYVKHSSDYPLSFVSDSSHWKVSF